MFDFLFGFLGILFNGISGILNPIIEIFSSIFGGFSQQ